VHQTDEEQPNIRGAATISMRRRTISLVATAGIALVVVLLFAPLANTERTVMAPDPSSFVDAFEFSLGQLSYLPVNQTGHSSLAYLWFGVGPPPSYESSNRCDTPQFVCSYDATSPYPDVFLALNGTQPIPQVDISQLHLRLNQSEFASVVVSFELRNNGPSAVEPRVILNGTMLSAGYAQVTNSSQSTTYSIVVYPAIIPRIGDHYFVEMGIASTGGAGASWWSYAQLEG
jgi:hypothetical protein